MLIESVLALCVLVLGPVYSEESDSLHLNVSSIEVTPYLFKEENGTSVEYVGYIRDLLDEMAAAGGFTYDLSVREDGQYGRLEGDKWTGVIGDVVNGKADVAAAPLTITMDREAAVDFTYAYLSFEAVAVMSRRHPDQEPVITSFEDIVNSEDIKVGVTKHSTISKVLQGSNNKLAQKLWKDLTLDPASFKKSNQEGINQARSQDDFAFILEGVTADWVLRKEPCDLISFPTGLYKRKYALVVPQGSPLRDRLNTALVDVQYSGATEELYDKWWGEDECSATWRLTPSLILICLLATTITFLRR